MSGKYGDLNAEQTKALEQFHGLVDADHTTFQTNLAAKYAKFAAEEKEKRDKGTAIGSEEKRHESETETNFGKLSEGQKKEEYERELLRFLRANKWNLANAEKSYKAYLQFREKYNLDSLIDFPLQFFPNKMALLSKIVPHAIHGFDREGSPLYIEKSGSCHVNALLQNFTEEEILLIHLWQQERLVRRCLHQNRTNSWYYASSSSSSDEKKNAEAGKKHIEQFYNILDLKGLALAHRSCLKFTKVIVSTDQGFYPERLKKMFIVNAPWVFPVIWNIVKHWLDPVTREKIVVLKTNYKEELLKYFDANQLPAEYGGTCNACTTSPSCIPVVDISDIVKSLKDDSAELELTSVKVAAGKKFVKTLTGAKDTVFGWYFKTAAHDISFSVEFVPKGKSDKEKQVVVEPNRVSADEMGQQGTWTASEDGTVFFVFDNSFSWMKGKEVLYNITAGEIERSMSRRNSVSNLAIHEKHEKEESVKGGGGGPAAASSP